MGSKPVTQSAMGDVLSWMAQGGTFKDMKHLSQHQLGVIYKMAYSRFNSGQYREAVTIFRHLCLMDHTRSLYFLGLGMSFFELSRFDLAIAALEHGKKLDKGDPRASLMMGKCFKEVGQTELAIQALSESLLRAKKDNRWSKEHQQAEYLLSLMRH